MSDCESYRLNLLTIDFFSVIFEALDFFKRSDIVKFDELITRTGQQPVAILVPFDHHESIFVTMPERALKSFIKLKIMMIVLQCGQFFLRFWIP